jgi:hypothetical protein
VGLAHAVVPLRLAFLAVPLLILVSVPAVQAQDAAATPGTTFFVHNFVDPTGAGSFLNLLPPDGEADQTSAPDPQPTPLAITIPGEAPLAATYTAVGTAGEAVVWVKGFNSAPAPQEKVTIEVMAGGTSLAKGTLTQNILPTAPVVEYRIPLTFTATEIPAGSALSMVVSLETSGCGCYTLTGYPRGVSPDHPWQVRIPFVAPPSSGLQVARLNVTTPGLDLSGSFANATTRATHVNWTQGPARSLAILAANVTAGNLTVTVRDAANRTLWQAAATNGTLNQTLTGTAGAWSLWVNATAFRGSYHLSIVPLVEARNVTATPTSTSRATTATISATSSSKGTAGLTAPLALLAVLAVAAGRPRRR